MVQIVELPEEDTCIRCGAPAWDLYCEECEQEFVWMVDEHEQEKEWEDYLNDIQGAPAE